MKTRFIPRIHIAIIFLGLMGVAMGMAAESFALYPPPAQITTPRVFPECIQAEKSSSYDEGKIPAIAITSNCSFDIILNEITASHTNDKHPKASSHPFYVSLTDAPQYYKGQKNNTLSFDPNGSDCNLKAVSNHETQPVACKRIFLSLHHTLTIPMPYGVHYVVSGYSSPQDASDSFNVLIEGTMVNFLHPEVSLASKISEAEKGDPKSQLELGLLYLQNGPIRDYKEAEKWLTQAAKNGNGYAHYKLGVYYEEAKSVEKAIEWYKKTATLSDEYSASLSKCQLAAIYNEGKGVEKNYSEALKWWGIPVTDFNEYTHQAKNGDADAQLKIGDLYSSIKCLDKLIPHEIQTKMMDAYYQAANQGNTKAQYRLGTILYGEVFHVLNPERDKNLEDAYFWLSLAKKSQKDHAAEIEKIITHLISGGFIKSDRMLELDKRINDWKPIVLQKAP